MKFKKLRITFIIILTVIFAVSAFHIIKITHDYKTADKVNTELQERFVQEIEPTDAEVKAPISIDFDALKQENSDIIGWIYCPDTPLNYPVVKGKDNNQYLRTDLKGNYLISGTIFADYRNGNVGEDKNHIVYGHNMKNTTMFGLLVNYKEQSYYDEHPVLYYLTPSGDYQIDLYAGIVVSRDALIYNSNPDKAELQDFLDNAKEDSTFQSDVVIEDDDLLITLSTCSYEYNNARYIVIGKLSCLS